MLPPNMEFRTACLKWLLLRAAQEFAFHKL